MKTSTRRRAFRAVAAAFAGALLSSLPAAPGAAALPTGAAPLCGTEAGALHPSSSQPRVATYNVLHGLEQAPDYPAHTTLDVRAAMVADQIAAAGVDVVGMQEVALTAANAQTAHTPGLVVEQIAERLASVGGYAWHWCWYLANPHFTGEPDVWTGGGGPFSDFIATLASSRYASFKEGVAILSRRPIVRAEARRLPGRLPAEAAFCDPLEPLSTIPPICVPQTFVESRVALFAQVDTPGRDVEIVTTHLSHNLSPLSDHSAAVQAAAVAAFGEEMWSGVDVARQFIVCDCNATVASEAPVTQAFTALGFVDAARGSGADPCAYPGAAYCTSGGDVIASDEPARVMTERIDYVFARDVCGVAGVLMLGAVPIVHEGRALWASDHLGVAARTEC